MPQGVGDAGQFAQGVVAEAGAPAGTVGVAHQQAAGVVFQLFAFAQCVGDAFRQAGGSVAVAGYLARRVGDAGQVASGVVAVFGQPPGVVGHRQRQVQFVVVVDEGAAAVGCGNGYQVAGLVVAEAGLPPQCVGLHGDAAEVVAFAFFAPAGGVDVVNQFVIGVEAEGFRPAQYVADHGMPVAVVERPSFAGIVAAFEHFAVTPVTVVAVTGNQSVRLAVFHHDVVAVGETAQFFAVAAVNGGQVAAPVVAVADQFAVVEGNGAQPVDVQTAVFGPEDARLAIRLETVAGPVQPPHRGRLKNQLSDGLYINQRINR